jgi:hypothetical protein
MIKRGDRLAAWARPLQSPLWVSVGVILMVLTLASWEEMDAFIDDAWHKLRPVSVGTVKSVVVKDGGVEFDLTVERKRACTFDPPPYGYAELPGGSRAVARIAKLAPGPYVGTDFPPGHSYHSGVWRIEPIAGAKAAIMVVRYTCDGSPVYVDLARVPLP